jgi:hypothetical protein
MAKKPYILLNDGANAMLFSLILSESEELSSDCKNAQITLLFRETEGFIQNNSKCPYSAVTSAANSLQLFAITMRLVFFDDTRMNI